MSEITNPPTVPEISTPVPQRTDPESFSVLMDRFLREMPVTVDGINVAVQWTYDTTQVVKEFSQAAAKSVDDAAQQVELAKKEAGKATTQADRAKQEAQRAEKEADRAEGEAKRVEALAGLIDESLGLPSQGVPNAPLKINNDGTAIEVGDIPLGSAAFMDVGDGDEDIITVGTLKEVLGPWALTAASPIRGTASDITAEPYQMIGANTRTGSITVTLPSNPTPNMWVRFFDIAATWDENNLIIARNGARIMQLDEDMHVDIKGGNFTLTYYNDTRGWVLT